MTLSGTTLMIATVIIISGMTLLWIIKSSGKKVESDFSSFFIGGGKVGENLTANNNWGLCFAFANALWYYCYLGYYFGYFAFFLQLPWSIAVLLLSRFIYRYVEASNFGTVHGFIEEQFGIRAATLAAVATLIGYTLNIGFEVFYSSYLISYTIGLQEVSFILSIFIAIFIGAYCLSGGYSASIKTDKYQNVFGLIVSFILVAALLPKFFQATGGILPWSTKASFDAIPWHLICGVAVFSFFFNFVDMANWQSIAANRGLPTSDLRLVGRGFIKSSAMQLIAPALCGTWLGVILKTIDSKIPDDGYFASALSLGIPVDGILGGILIGFTLLGFLYITISSAGSYVLAGMQTLAVDIVWRKDIGHYADNYKADIQAMEAPQKVLEKEVVRWVKKWVTLCSIFCVIVFSSMYYGLGHFDVQGIVFQFQFAMYGAAVTLVPTVFFGMIAMKQGKKPILTKDGSFYSIILGLIFVIVPFVFSISPFGKSFLDSIGANFWLPMSSDAMVNLTPVYGLVASSITSLAFLRRG